MCHPELACPPNGRDSGSRFRIKSGMTKIVYFTSLLSFAALINSKNKGCDSNGEDLNSG